MAVSASAESSHVTSETRRHVSMYEASERDHSASEWYFTRREIEENSPSRRDGIDLKKESYLRKSYCTFLQDLGMRLKVPQVTIATAIIFCHRFFLRQSHAKNDRRTIATVCMFLAGKVEETPHSLNSVILVSYDIIHKKDPAARQRIKQKEVYEQQKELILLGERVVLTTLGFDLNVHHPYRPLVEAIKKFRVAQNALAQVAWNFVNDGLRTSLCLQYKPHHIAAGAIFLAAKFLKVKLPSDGDKVWWQEFDVTPRQLEDVSNQMLELYEQNHTVQASHGGSEIEGGSTSNVTVTRPLPPPKPASEDAVSASGRAVHHVGNAAAADDAMNPSKSEGISDAMKKIDKDKVKAALEKRKQSRGSSLPRGAINEDDLIEQELESGVELAAKDERKKASSMNGEVGMEESSAAEEGELSSIDCQEPHQRPKLSIAAANSKRPQHLESGDQQPPSSGRDSVEREPKRARHEAHL